VVAGSCDVPAVVVEEEMVVLAEQDAVSDVGPAVIPFPLVDVMRFGLARVWWTS
jgi:hypothetical protein